MQFVFAINSEGSNAKTPSRQLVYIWLVEWMLSTITRATYPQRWPVGQRERWNTSCPMSILLTTLLPIILHSSSQIVS